MNLFDSKSAAARYSKGRPYFHPTTINRIKAFLSIQEPLTRAIDVGCGTGLSTIALRAIASLVIGVDSSIEMISLAERHDGINYLVASADRLPFANASFDLMTLSQALHWLDRDLFLDEARRVVRPSSCLVVYDSYFGGSMKENEAFEAWFRANYLKRFPPPLRAKLTFSDEDSENSGFHLLRHERFSNGWRFTLTELVDYLLTHSNVIAAVEYGEQGLDVVRSWLTNSMRPFFDHLDQGELNFEGVIWYLRCP